VVRDYLAEDQQYRREQALGERFAQHVEGGALEPDLLHLLSWDCMPAAGARLLEVGCGDGFVTAELAERGFEVTGIDCSPAAIDGAARNLAARGLKAHLLVADACLPVELPGSPFSAVLDSHCLHCVTEPAHRLELLAAVRRHLGPGGRLFLATMAEQPMAWIREGGPLSKRYVCDERGCWTETVVYVGATERCTSRVWITEELLRQEIASARLSIERFERFSPPSDPEDYTFLVSCR
jgi:SAM-dependent methyltransferase